MNSLDGLDSLNVRWVNNNALGCPDDENGGGNCVGGRCGSGYSCSRNNMCCERVIPATVCPGKLRLL